MLRLGLLQLINNLMLAPMAGYTDLAFRLLAKSWGAGMVFSEMVSACGLVSSNAKTEQYLRTSPDEYPLAVQIFGADPDYMAAAAIVLEERGVAAIDVNMGCPVRKVIRSGAGAALMTNIPLARKIIQALRKAVSIPITIKLRSGWDTQSINCHVIAKVAEDCGVDGVIIHPRTARQLFEGRADWAIIREVKERVSIPVIGNGDLRVCQDVIEMEARTGCDGVMVGRGALGNPWIFKAVNDYRASGVAPPPPPPDTLLTTMLRHLHLLSELYGERIGVSRFKAHVAHYLRGIRGAKGLRLLICSQGKSHAEVRQAMEKLSSALFRQGECQAEETFSFSNSCAEC